MSVQFTIIDGYNLLNSVGFLRSRSVHPGPNELNRARRALLGFLAEFVDDESRRRTTVVFDSKIDAPDLPETEKINDVQVIYAVNHDEADDLIELLIKRHSAPRQLTVVSSDHRLQRAASRRQAKFVDSEVWFEHKRQARPEFDDAPPSPKSAQAQLSPEETNRWIDEFEIDDAEKLVESSQQEFDETSPSENENDDGEVEADEHPFSREYLDRLLDELDES